MVSAALDEKVRISEKELELSNALVDSFASDFDPSKFSDEYQEQLAELIEAKLKKGDDVSTAETFGEEEDEEKGGEVLDLMAALQRSVEKNREAAKASKKAAPRKKKSAS